MKTILSLLRALAAVCVPLVAFGASAQTTIEIIGGGAQQYPIAITSFPGEAALPQGMAQIVRDDLNRSGLFKLVDASNLPVRVFQGAQLGAIRVYKRARPQDAPHPIHDPEDEYKAHHRAAAHDEPPPDEGTPE